MKTIVVSGKHSNIGKTYLAEELLCGLPGWSALKVTVSKNGVCPRNKKCGVCPGIKGPFSIIRDKKTINHPGKDTARLKQAGAKEVLWLQARPSGLKQGLACAFLEFRRCRGVVIEGNSVLKFIKPDLKFHISSKGDYRICR